MLIVLTLVLIAASFPVGAYTLFDTKLSANYSASTPFAGIYFFVGPEVVLAPISGTFGALFVVLSVIYAAMFVFEAGQGQSVIGAVKGAFSAGFESLFRNNLLVTVIAIGFLNFTVSVFDLLETSAGVPIGSLSLDPVQFLLTVTIAPLREELGFRVVIIGLLALVACIGTSWRQVARTLWRPSAIYDGRGPDTRDEILLGVGLAVSSVVFGIAHVTSGSGWEIGKLPEAAYGGVVLGYVYIKYGFPVAVLVHWGDDYLGTVYAFFGQGAYGIPYNSTSGYLLENIVSVDMFYLLGLLSFLAVAYIGLKRFTKRPTPEVYQVS
ncbi:MAG TPA: CPBP family glutamic-type intramembrane protease [Nitrososphaerales archaeon]|nr:CPBP family glutamic-type intramembrane protease [Nitrososphaerales archaeon]